MGVTNYLLTGMILQVGKYRKIIRGSQLPTCPWRGLGRHIATDAFLFGTFGCHNIIISQKVKFEKCQGNALYQTWKCHCLLYKCCFFTHLYESYTSLELMYVLHLKLKPISSVEFRGFIASSPGHGGEGHGAGGHGASAGWSPFWDGISVRCIHPGRLPSRGFTYPTLGSSENHRLKMPFLGGYVSSLED